MMRREGNGYESLLVERSAGRCCESRLRGDSWGADERNYFKRCPYGGLDRWFSRLCIRRLLDHDLKYSRLF